MKGRQTSPNEREVLKSFKNISFVHIQWEKQVRMLTA